VANFASIPNARCAARWPAAVYLGSRLLILVLAWADMLITHRSLGAELSREPALYDEVWSWGTKALQLGPDSKGRS